MGDESGGIAGCAGHRFSGGNDRFLEGVCLDLEKRHESNIHCIFDRFYSFSEMPYRKRQF